QHVFRQPLRPRDVAAVRIQYRLEQRVAARDRVADDEYVGVGCDRVELGRVVTFGQRDAEARKLRAHRRIDIGVATGDRMPALARDRGYPAHECPADAEDVQMHACRFQSDFTVFSASARPYALSRLRVYRSASARPE